MAADARIRLGMVVDEQWYTGFFTKLGGLLRGTGAVEPLLVMARDDAPDPEGDLPAVRFGEQSEQQPAQEYRWEDITGYEESLARVDRYYAGRCAEVARSLCGQMETWLAGKPIDCLLVWSGCRLASRALAAAARACQVPVVTLESPYFQELPEPPETDFEISLHRMTNKVLIWDTVQAPQCGPCQLTRDWEKAKVRPQLQQFFDRLRQKRSAKFSQTDIARFLSGKADATVEEGAQPDPAVELFKPPGMKALLVCGQVDRDSSMFFGNHLVRRWHDLGVEMAKRLPRGWTLWFKGHPLDRGYAAGIQDYADELLSLNPLCRVLPPTLDIHACLQACDAMACINSTAGIEAMTYELPVINLGHASYTHKGMTYSLDSLEELPGTIANLPAKMTAEQRDIRDHFLSYVLYDYLIPVGSPQRMVERIREAIGGSALA